MQWTRDGGFTTGKPWLPYGDLAVNAHDDPLRMLALDRALIAVRREFAEADYGTLHASGGVLAFARGDRVAVALNLTSSRSRCRCAARCC